MNVKRQGKVDHCKFDDDQPDPAGEEEASGRTGFKREVGRYPRQEYKRGRTKVSDPAREKQERRGRGEVGGALDHGVDMEEVPGVIQGHDDHDQAPGDIYGSKATHR